MLSLTSGMRKALCLFAWTLVHAQDPSPAPAAVQEFSAANSSDAVAAATQQTVTAFAAAGAAGHAPQGPTTLAGQDDGPQPIINGVKVQTARSYMVSLQSLEEPLGHACGGSLIDPSWVITAAHCVVTDDTVPTADLRPRDIDSLEVWIGGTDLSVEAGFVKRAIERIILQPEGMDVDMALLKLVEPVTTLAPISFNCDQSLPSTSLSGTPVNALGWGTCTGPNCAPVDPNNEFKPLELQETELIPASSCSAACGPGNTNGCSIRPNIPADVLDRNSFCTWKRQNSVNFTSICWGDSGGPYVIMNGAGEEVLVGLTSITNACAVRKPPIKGPVVAPLPDQNNMVGGASRTSAHCDWIRSTMAAPAPSPLTCGTLSNLGQFVDASACTNVGLGKTCLVKCATGCGASPLGRWGASITIYRCVKTASGVLQYVGNPLRCGRLPATCTTPWGSMRLGTSMFVRNAHGYYATASKRCSGMWVLCNAFTRRFTVQCTY